MNYDIIKNINIIKNSKKKKITKTRGGGGGGCSPAAHRHEPPLMHTHSPKSDFRWETVSLGSRSIMKSNFEQSYLEIKMLIIFLEII